MAAVTTRIQAVRDIVTGRDSVFQKQRPASAPITHLLPVARLSLARPLSPRVTLKANAGHYGRTPSFLELYGDTGPLLGNPLLRPESGWTGDLGAVHPGEGDEVAAGVHDGDRDERPQLRGGLTRRGAHREREVEVDLHAGEPHAAPPR